MHIEVDPRSGFCFGVTNTIRKAEELLEHHKTLYCLGEIVHNQKEIERLQALGLETIDHERLRQLHDCIVLIRAHGEPPGTYEIAAKNNITLVDATCPVVLRLQNKIKQVESKDKGQRTQIVIYGKENHPEVIGLRGQTNLDTIIAKTKNDLSQIDFTRPVRMYSQTTMSREGFAEMAEEVEKCMTYEKAEKADLEINDSVCRQVSNREPHLLSFCKKFDVMLFVAGRSSSNGKMLYELCKSVNPRSYYIDDSDKIVHEWFEGAQSIGITGATSTPSWLLVKVADYLKAKYNA